MSDKENETSSADSWGCSLIIITLILCTTLYHVLKLFYG